MAKHKAPVKLTGGGGFGYEDATAAFFMVHMLSASRYLGDRFGPIISIEFQVRDRGWLLDDLLIHFAGPAGPRFLALSVKSDRQVTRRGFPADFTTLVWQHWQGGDSGPFRRDSDLLGLVVGELADGVKTEWDTLLREAQSTSPERIAERLTTAGQSSTIKRAIFQSLQCPNGFQSSGSGDAVEIARLLKHMLLLHFDFLSSYPSRDATDSLGRCQACLEDGNADDATRLWDRLLQMAAKLRPAGGTLDLAQLIREVRPDFRLNAYPDHTADWRRLTCYSRSSADRVHNQVGADVQLERAELRGSVTARMREARVLILIGESGCGKSAIAKEIISDQDVTSQCVWISSDSWDHCDLEVMRRTLGLNSDLLQLLRHATADHAVLVLDALDRFSDRALKCASDVLRGLELGADGGPWCVLGTAERQGWERVERTLDRSGVDVRLFRVEPVGLLTEVEVGALLRRIPSLRLMATRKEAVRLCRNLKVLDFVALTAASRPTEGRTWIGLSETMDWIWEFWIDREATEAGWLARAAMLRKLGQIEGDSLIGSVPTSVFDAAELRTLGDLESRSLVRIEVERIRFAHDLVGDWSRVRTLIEEALHRPASLCQRAALPRWHRAIRLFGQRLLEAPPGGVDNWRKMLDACACDEESGELTRDLLLESVVFAINAPELLERVWPDLARDGGALLRRLLNCFLHSATVPDPYIIEVARNRADARLLAASMRIPDTVYWLPVLTVLERHIDEIVGMPGVFAPVAHVCGLWLRSVPVELPPGRRCPGRAEAARVAVRLAREVQALKAEGVWFQDEIDESAYEAMLYGVPDLPDETTGLVLELVGRRDWDTAVRDRAAAYKRAQAENEEERQRDPAYRERISKLPFTCGPGPLPRGPRRLPWPDGPIRKVDGAFRTICLKDASAVSALIATAPSIAREVVLAVCIEEPGFEDPFDGQDFLLDHVGIESLHDGTPPMYFRGPFFQFLRQSPDEGLELILRLVNFASERWVEAEMRRRAQYGDVELVDDMQVVSFVVHDGSASRVWLGDHRVHGWSRNMLINADCVVSSLMALEKWLYDEIDAGHDVEKWLSLIIERSRSAAFAGVLVSVGLRNPEFFAGPLLPLLGAWQLYGWNDWLLHQGDVWQIEMMQWVRWGESVFELARDWHAMPHRKASLRNGAVQLLLTRREVAEYFTAARERWHDEFPRDQIPETLEFLMARFDRRNYKPSSCEDGSILVELEWPEPLRVRSEAALENSRRGVFILGFPIRCRQLLDERTPLEANKLDTFWTQIREIAAFGLSADVELTHGSIAASVCGGVAVLFSLHRDWLAADTDREHWCIDQVFSVVASPPQASVIDIPESVSTLGWDCFAAELFVAMLVESPSDVQVRELAAIFACGYLYVATRLAMQEAFRRRETLGGDFVRLQNLMVLWSGLRSVTVASKRCNTDMSRWNRRGGRLIEAFRERRIGSRPLRWEKVARIGRRAIHRIEKQRFPRIDDDDDIPDHGHEPLVVSGERRRRDRWSIHPGLDVQVIQAAFSWLVPLNRARFNSERREWIATLHQCLGVTLSILPDFDDEDQEVRGTPSGYDGWVFEKVAGAVAEMHAEERPEELWRPILDLGAPAHYWVSSFLRAWFIHGARAAASPSSFAHRWREMIRYALKAPKWRGQGDRLEFRRSGLMTELMGLSWHSGSIGESDYINAFQSLKSEFSEFAEIWLCVPRVASRFAAFLARPAGQALLGDGIVWLEAAVRQFDCYDWRNDHLEANLVEALRKCWYSSADDVRNTPSIRKAFLGLLGMLIRRQNNAALELRDEVTQSMG